MLRKERHYEREEEEKGRRGRGREGIMEGERKRKDR